MSRAFPGHERVEVLRDISFRVERGEVVGYIGPNGSGKSTTIKCLTGVLVPSAGKVECLGLVPWEQRLEYTAQIGVLFGQKSLLFWDLPVSDALEVYRRIYGV
ncbi:MAG: ATP-binding cassette domain-containing protein, partial [Candidatus Wallbacteria bacterium]|nr:ATP-binding cassette domain-containing protein [Candidatus Wallbacteria bacterium]